MPENRGNIRECSEMKGFRKKKTNKRRKMKTAPRNLWDKADKLSNLLTLLESPEKKNTNQAREW